LSKKCENKKFEILLLETLAEALSTLGENVKKTIYFHLQQNFLIAKKEIPHKIVEFSDALEQIFGLGART
jgi:hypothetical protein